MWHLPRRIAGHLVDRTDREEVLRESQTWRAERSLEDYFIDMRSKLASLSADPEEQLLKLRAAIPVALCQYAIGFYQRHRRNGDAEDLHWFLTCADILEDTQQHDGIQKGAWLHDIPSPYRSKRPWVCAMAQGEALSVLVRACIVAENPSRYEEAAQLAVQPFFHALEEGGVTSRDDSGRVYLEEYPSDPPSHVLNGWIFALVGLREYADAFSDKRADSLATEALASLVAALPEYDTGYWSRYDLFPRFPMAFLASRFYHRLHIAQFRAMFAMTRKGAFRDFADRWESYMASRSCRFRYAHHRLRFKIRCFLTGW